MGFGEEFRNAFGTGRTYRGFAKADRDRLEETVPGYLLNLWESDGWAGYRDGLLWTVDPHEYEPVVAAWRLPVGPLTPVARTAFGAVYALGTFAPSDGASGSCVWIIDPIAARYSIPGPFAEQFLTKSIARERYMRVLWESEAKRAAKDVGSLAWDEMYGFEPALALGGSGAPETVRRFNIFNHHRLLSQLVEPKHQKY